MGQGSAAGVRIGHGYDLHRLAPIEAAAGQERGRAMVLGGVRFEHTHGPVAHSDGDALLHAVADSILGALGLPDIGQAFPDTDPRWAGAESSQFVRAAVALARERGWRVGNLDATVICERPKIGPRKAEVVASVARLLEVEAGCVNVKGKTHERVDAVGEGRAIEVHAVVVMVGGGGGGGKQ